MSKRLYKNESKRMWFYIAGMLESDGGLMCSFKTGGINPMVKFTQKTNTNVLSEIRAFLATQGINSGVDTNAGKKGRGPSLRIQGRGQIARFIRLFREGTKGDDLPDMLGQDFPLASAKYRDLLILEELCTNNSLNKAQKLALIKSLHKMDKDQPDLSPKGSLSRSVYETRFGLPPGESQRAGESILSDIDSKFNVHRRFINLMMKGDILAVDTNYLVGLIDGDGMYSIEFRMCPQSIIWKANFKLAMEINAELTLEVFKYAFDLKKKIYDHPLKTSKFLTIVAQPDMQKLIDLHKECPSIGHYKRSQHDLVVRLFKLKETNRIKDLNEVKSVLTDIYHVSSLSTSGKPRKYTLQQALELAEERLS